MLDRTIAPPSYPINWVQFPTTQTYTTEHGVDIHSISLGEQPVFKFEYTVQACEFRNRHKTQMTSREMPFDE